MKRSILGICALLLAAQAQAQLSVRILPPRLGEGMAGLQAMVDEGLLGFSDQIEAYILGNFDKPLFMEGFSKAAAVSVLVPAASHESALPFLSFGSTASLFAADLSPATFRALAAMSSGADTAAGACVQPFLAKAAFPLKGKLGSYDLGGSLGGSVGRAGDFGLASIQAGLFGGYRVPGRRWGVLEWEGLRAELGADFALSELAVYLRTGRISQTLPIDPDGPSGPLLPFNATFSIDPDIEAGVRSGSGGAHIQASTALRAYRALSLSLAAGLSLGWAGSSLYLSTRNAPIEVEGYLSSLIDQEGSISVEGTVSSRSLLSGGLYLCPGLRLAFGSFSLSASGLWLVPGGFGAGLSIGMAL